MSELLSLDDEDSLQETYDRRRMEITRLRQASSKKRMFKKRQSWAAFQTKLTDRQFRRYFRMSRECFKYLCKRIEENIGSSKFKSEQYLCNLRSGRLPNQGKQRMDNAHLKSTGGFISGEVKLALTLRLLAGGSYMDLSLLYETGFTYSYEVFHDVITNWINDDRLVKISGKDYLNDEEKMKEVARDFALGSNGLITGAIGALDGWLVKIRRPRQVRDGVRNPGSYFSRKGYFAVNVQVICDKKKRILYRSILCRGAEHDSTAFKFSALNKLLTEKWRWLLEKGFYILGDSAYLLRSYLVTPIDNSVHGTPQDNFNFFHSSSRISIECAFGEIDMRWGILWKPLGFSLKNNLKVIDACLRLHNFIVDFREAEKEVSPLEELERLVFDEDCRRFMAVNPDLDHYGVDGGEDDPMLDEDGNPDRGGRPFLQDTLSRQAGLAVRTAISNEIGRRRCERPRVNWFRKDNRFINC